MRPLQNISGRAHYLSVIVPLPLGSGDGPQGLVPFSCPAFCAIWICAVSPRLPSPLLSHSLRLLKPRTRNAFMLKRHYAFLSTVPLKAVLWLPAHWPCEPSFCGLLRLHASKQTPIRPKPVLPDCLPAPNQGCSLLPVPQASNPGVSLPLPCQPFQPTPLHPAGSYLQNVPRNQHVLTSSTPTVRSRMPREVILSHQGNAYHLLFSVLVLSSPFSKVL